MSLLESESILDQKLKIPIRVFRISFFFKCVVSNTCYCNLEASLLLKSMVGYGDFNIIWFYVFGDIQVDTEGLFGWFSINNCFDMDKIVCMDSSVYIDCERLLLGRFF